MTDPEILMMRVLDGEALNASENQVLCDYLAAHPAERVIFTRMQGIERVAGAGQEGGRAPAGFAQGVMALVARQPAPTRRGVDTFDLVAALAIVVALAMMVVAVAIVVLVPASAWQAGASALSSVVGTLLELPRALLSVLAVVSLSVLRSPFVVFAFGLIGVWLAMLVRVYAPRRATARAWENA